MMHPMYDADGILTDTDRNMEQTAASLVHIGL
jgi:hypothetical protein